MFGSAIRIAVAVGVGVLLLPELGSAQADPVSRALQGEPTERKFQIMPQVGFRPKLVDGPDVSLGARFVYSPAPEVGFELFGYSYLLGITGDTDALVKLSIRQDQNLPHRTELLWALGLGAWWRPIYGAIAFEDYVLGRFRVGFGAGMAVGATRVECTNGLALDPNRGFPVPDGGPEAMCNPFEEPPVGESNDPRYYEPNTIRPMGVLGAAFEVELMERLNFRFEVRDLLFVARVYRPDDEPSLEDDVVHRVFIQLGLGIPF